MPDGDLISRGDLTEHCAYRHDAIKSEFVEVRSWLGKLDGRLWAMIVGLAGLLLTSGVNMVINLSTKSAVSHEASRQIMYDANRDAIAAGEKK